jgi:hypothetical protein
MTPVTLHPACRRALSLLLMVALVVAPALGWTANRLFDQPSAQQADGCCAMNQAAERPSNQQHPNDQSDPCKDCRAGFCLCVGGVFVVDPPAHLTGDVPSPRLQISIAQLSHPESASLEDIFHPPRV